MQCIIFSHCPAFGTGFSQIHPVHKPNGGEDYCYSQTSHSNGLSCKKSFYAPAVQPNPISVNGLDHDGKEEDGVRDPEENDAIELKAKTTV